MKKQYFTPAVKVHTLLVETPILGISKQEQTDAAIGTNPTGGQSQQPDYTHPDVDEVIPSIEGDPGNI